MMYFYTKMLVKEKKNHKNLSISAIFLKNIYIK